MDPLEKMKRLYVFIERSLEELAKDLGSSSLLKDVICYTLLSGGKRFRPLLVYLVSEALGKRYPVMPGAIAVECFHTASLIADDLPCMDNEKSRRGKPCVHHVYPESVVILASYTLISLGYENIYKNAKIFPGTTEEQNALGMQVIETVTRAAGIFGATNGQFLDLFPPDHTIVTLEKITEQKTVTLFTISFVTGWLFGGGDPSMLPKVRQMARHLGKAFQLRDDLLDLANDQKKSCHSNLADLLGEEKARSCLRASMEAFRYLLKELNIETKELQLLAKDLEEEKSLFIHSFARTQ